MKLIINKPNKLSISLCGILLLQFQGCGGKTILTQKPTEMSVPENLSKNFDSVQVWNPSQNKAVIEATVEVPSASKKQKKKTKKEMTHEALVVPTIQVGSEQMNGPGNPLLKIPSRRPKFDPVWVGEKILMEVTWLGTKGGEFLLEVLPFKNMGGRKVYDLKGFARTSDLFSVFYRAEDWVESFVDYEGWFPYKFQLHGDESKHIRNNLELFDHYAKRQYVHIHDFRVKTNETEESKGFKDLTPFSLDALSALYYLRTQELKSGAEIIFPMTTNGNQWETKAIVVAREEISTKMGYKQAWKVKVETRFNGVLKQEGDSFLWFSDDERKFLLRFDAKVKIGWVSGLTKSIDPGNAPVAEPVSSVDSSELKKEPGTEKKEKNKKISSQKIKTTQNDLVEDINPIAQFEAMLKKTVGSESHQDVADITIPERKPTDISGIDKNAARTNSRGRTRTWFKNLLQTIIPDKE